MSRKRIAVLSRAEEDGRTALLSPGVGLWRGAPEPGTCVVMGGSVGQLEVLGTLHEMTSPAAGVVADIIGIYPYITADQVREALRNGADQIGPYTYPSGRNDYYGHGRVNLEGSLNWIKNANLDFDCDFEDTLIAGRWSLNRH